MPIVVGLGFWVLKPEYIRLLYTDHTGTKFLTYAIILGDRRHSGDSKSRQCPKL